MDLEQECKHKIKLDLAYRNLQSNTDFQFLIEQVFCTDEVLDLASQLARQEASNQDTSNTAFLIKARRYLDIYLSNLASDAENARLTLQDLKGNYNEYR